MMESQDHLKPNEKGLYVALRTNCFTNFCEIFLLRPTICDRRSKLPSKTVTNGMINNDTRSARVVIKVQELVESDM